MNKRDITILVYFDRISLYYSAYPFFIYKDKKRLKFATSLEYCLKKDDNKKLIILRYFEFNKEDFKIDILKQLRNKYEKIIYFDDGDSSTKTRFEVLPYVDFYYKKQILEDKNKYLEKFYCGSNISDYYHRNFGIEDDQIIEREFIKDKNSLAKIKIAWNLGIGLYPIIGINQNLGLKMLKTFGLSSSMAIRLVKILDSKYHPHNTYQVDVHARFSIPSRPTLGHQRKLTKQKLLEETNAKIGKTNQWKYNYEIRNAKIVVSPFGWGEICFRDFEAFLNKSILLKPSMDHISTWPNIFIPFETYIPYNWKVDNLTKRVKEILEMDQKDFHQIVSNSNELWINSLSAKEINLRTEEMISDTD